jgi:hypothetical protein
MHNSTSIFLQNNIDHTWIIYKTMYSTNIILIVKVISAHFSSLLRSSFVTSSHLHICLHASLHLCLYTAHFSASIYTHIYIYGMSSHSTIFPITINTSNVNIQQCKKIIKKHVSVHFINNQRVGLQNMKTMTRIYTKTRPLYALSTCLHHVRIS